MFNKCNAKITNQDVPIFASGLGLLQPVKAGPLLKSTNDAEPAEKNVKPVAPGLESSPSSLQAFELDQLQAELPGSYLCNGDGKQPEEGIKNAAAHKSMFDI